MNAVAAFRSRAALAISSVVVFLGGCGDSTGPVSGMNGLWQVTYTNVSVGGDWLRCDDFTINYIIAAPDSSFAGAQSGKTRIHCDARSSNEPVIDVEFTDLRLFNGHLSPFGAVTWDVIGEPTTTPSIDAPRFSAHHTGDFSGDRAHGEAVVLVVVNATMTNLSGDFTARRK